MENERGEERRRIGEENKGKGVHLCPCLHRQVCCYAIVVYQNPPPSPFPLLATFPPTNLTRAVSAVFPRRVENERRDKRWDGGRKYGKVKYILLHVSFYEWNKVRTSPIVVSPEPPRSPLPLASTFSPPNLTREVPPTVILIPIEYMLRISLLSLSALGVLELVVVPTMNRFFAPVLH